MAQATVLELFPQTPYSGTTTIVGDKQPAAAYYRATASLQTISWYLTSVIGLITIQASLATNPDESNDDDWVTVYTINGMSGALTGIDYENINGNFVWLRAKIVSFTQGTIQYMKVSY